MPFLSSLLHRKWVHKRRSIGKQSIGDRFSKRPMVEILENRQLLSTIVADGSFETPALAGDPSNRNTFQIINPSGSAWDFSPNSGLLYPGVPPDFIFEETQRAPDGNQVAWLKIDDERGIGRISQQIELPTTGTYELSYIVKGRDNPTSPPGTLNYQVRLDNLVITTERTTGGPSNQYENKRFTFEAIAGTHVLSFNVLDTSGDHAAVFDTVSIVGDKPDISATSLTWNTIQGRVDFKYKVTSAQLPQDTTAQLYWATGTTFADAIGPAVHTAPLAQQVGAHGPFFVSNTALGAPPPTATHLLLVVDPDNTIQESDEPTAGDFGANNVKALAMPDIQVVSATTTDSRGVTFDYQITGAALQSFEVAIYRSADANFDPAIDVLLKEDLIAAGAPGATHSAIVNVDLSINPSLPYVLVVADPAKSIIETDELNNEAHFQKHVLGVVTHGLIPGFGLHFDFPDWVGEVADTLKSQNIGYDEVVEFYWLDNSRALASGMTFLEGDRMAGVVRGEALRIANQPGFQAGRDVVDVHLIGHSRGAVVVSQALQKLQSNPGIVALESGYKKMTMLDPHPASNSAALALGIAEVLNPFNFNGVSTIGQFSFNRFNRVSRTIVAPFTLYFQSIAQDPDITIPLNVHETEVYYQHSLAREVGGQYMGDPRERTFLNLWGKPISGATSYDLTDVASGISHTGVVKWFAEHVLDNSSIARQQPPDFVDNVNKLADNIDPFAKLDTIPVFDRPSILGTSTQWSTSLDRAYVNPLATATRLESSSDQSIPTSAWASPETLDSAFRTGEFDEAWLHELDFPKPTDLMIA